MARERHIWGLLAGLAAFYALAVGCGGADEDDGSVKPECSSESKATCRMRDGCVPVNSTFYDDDRLCKDTTLKFCLNSPDPHPEMAFTTNELLIPMIDPEGNCWQFSGYYPKNWKLAEAGDNCPPGYRTNCYDLEARQSGPE
jgi:hypothetical protein